ncbi:MAG: STT3 domain-containing protein, partial [Nitrosarchaeum sp.]
MISNITLFSLGKSNLKLHHLLIVGILSLSFSVSFLVRSQTADYGWELNEFDPFFNYRATQYIVDNGINAYFQWNDNLSWYPNGRDVSQTSQVILHITTAFTYWIFGGGMELYDFTILFPVIFGSLSSIVIFALVRVIGGTTAGLFSALFFSVSLPLILRGTIGWFKSEPLGLFFGLLATYFLLSGINSKNKKIAIAKLIAAGITMPLSLSA